MSELKVSTPAELKADSTKLVQCSSGHVYRIRKLSLPSMAMFLSAVDLETDFKQQLKDPVKARAFFEAIEQLLPLCIVEPKVTENPTEESITVADILPLDQIELFPVILEFSGFSEDKMKAIEKFREQPLRPLR